MANNQPSLNEISGKTEEVLLEIKSVFPFDFFPDTIRVDQNKVDIIYRDFFYSGTIFSILIKDIKNVSVSYNLLFGTLSFELQGFAENPPPVDYLKKNEARNARQMIIGLTAIEHETGTVPSIGGQNLVKKAMEIGRAE